MWIKGLNISLLVCSILASCSANDVTVIDAHPVVGQRLSFPPAYYQNVVDMGGRLLGFTYSLARKPSERVSYAYEGDTALHPFDPLHAENCSDFIGYRVKGLLPDGRIGFLGCGDGYNSSMLAINWKTGELERLVNGPLPRGYSPKDFSWNPEMTRGVQEMVEAAQGTIYWITPEGGVPMDVEVEDQGLKWNLKEFYEHPDDFKPGVGLALSPAWSPDGKTIAFLASTYGMREVPQLTGNIKYELYLMEPNELKPMQVLKGISNASRIRWSPDSKDLLFAGCAGLDHKCGLWIYSLENKSLHLVAEGNFVDYLWNSMNKVVAIKTNSGSLTYEDSEIWEYTVAKLLKPE